MKKAYQSYRCDICRANKNKKGDEIPNGWIKDGKYYACKSCIKAIQKHISANTFKFDMVECIEYTKKFNKYFKLSRSSRQ